MYNLWGTRPSNADHQHTIWDVLSGDYTVGTVEYGSSSMYLRYFTCKFLNRYQFVLPVVVRVRSLQAIVRNVEGRGVSK
jgi:hypothetical protein